MRTEKIAMSSYLTKEKNIRIFHLILQKTLSCLTVQQVNSVLTKL